MFIEFDNRSIKALRQMNNYDSFFSFIIKLFNLFLELMFKIRLILGSIVTLISIYLISVSKLNLGLDLSGGVHLLLESDFKEFLEEKYKNMVPQIKKTLKENKFRFTLTDINEDGIKFQLTYPASTNQNIINDLSGMDQNLLFTMDSSSLYAKYKNKDEVLADVIDQSINILRNRVDSTGTKELLIQKQGSNRIVLEMPGISNSEPLKNAIGKTARLSFHLVEDSKNNENKYLTSSQNEKLIVKSRPELTGDMIQYSNVVLDEFGKPTVSFKLNSSGAQIFGQVTSENIGRRLAIVLDDVIITAPNINSAIKEGSGVITGNFTLEEANELVNFLKSGSLKTKLKIIEERVIGPSLGAESIQNTKLAGIFAIISIMSFMAWYYRILGIFANISLVLSLVYMFAMLSIFNATLTLPGIAGIILTIGIAVDANILIYERIKEEFLVNKNLVNSVRSGFNGTINTILDSNITTLIVAVFLYIYGTGPIRGFAVTLTIGIIASMFSVLVMTKIMMDIWLKTKARNSW